MISSGIVMSRKGKPYNVILFNIHKFLSLGAIIMMVLTVIYYTRERALLNTETLLVSGSAFLFLILFISGGLLNIKKEMPRFVLYLHRLSPILLVVLSTYLIYTLLQQ